MCLPMTASGSPTLGMLVEMLVEGVFLVRGIVKTVWAPIEKMREFFVFHHEQKEVKQNFVVLSKSPLFLTETLRICSITSWFYFF
jgi:hypothetical protein